MNNAHPYDLVIGLDRSDKKPDLRLIDTATCQPPRRWSPTTPVRRD